MDISKWISVKEHMPNFNGNLIACIDGEKVISCSYVKDSKQFFQIETIKNVTHWMPIPQPPY